jgi:RNA polymerase sigma-70 factor, ECF subfamily
MRATEMLSPLLFFRRAPNVQEEDLIERLRRGDVAAIGQAYDQHYQAVRTFARRLTGDDASAEDLVHDVFVNLPQVMPRFRGASSLKTFLISIAVNHARHHLRAASRRRAAMERLAQEQTEATAPSPEGEVSRASLAQAVHRALDSLPELQRVAFVLCEVEELSAREAAEIMGVPEATARTRVFHAKQKLRALLEEEEVR